MNLFLITSFIFIVGYGFIMSEHYFPKLNKSAVSVAMSFFIWAFLIYSNHNNIEKIEESISETFQVLFFLMGALTLVEYIDYRNGFTLVSRRLSKFTGVKFIILISLCSFFASAVLDNMTTCLVMCVLASKLVKDTIARRYVMCAILLASNIGGAFTPIGDITTTMLWLKGLVSTKKLIIGLFLPCITAFIVSTAIICYQVSKLEAFRVGSKDKSTYPSSLPIIGGVGALLSVPILKYFIGLPPFLTILGGVSLVWVIDEFFVHEKCRDTDCSRGMLSKVTNTDITPILFFYGILMSVSGLNAANVLPFLAEKISGLTDNYTLIAFLVGIVSAVVDNVPMVASISYMFTEDVFAKDTAFWHILAYTAGIGGNLLILGSAAGVALLSIENIPIVWYITRITPIAFISYIAGIAVFMLQIKIISA
ncbi:MAG: hypothetical protein KAH32_03460 [Chlamydiia bacterium]|nr:hypothetical protein [Chlamydiia bacterium]